MERDIRISTLGKITEGDNKGDYILIEPAEPGSEDFLIFFGSTTDPKHSGWLGDMWAENKEHLEKIF